MLQFTVKNQTMNRTDKFKVVADSRNYLTANFIFSDEWTSPVTAVFKYDESYYNVLLEGNSCIVPWEVIKAPFFTVSVFSGDRITTNVIQVSVEKSGYVIGESPKDPTPDVYSKIIALNEETKKIAQSVRDDADSGVFKGADGYTPQKGTDYFDGANGKDGANGINGQDGYTPQKGIDYFTENEKNEIVGNIYNILKEMGSLDIVKYISGVKIALTPGKIYYFEGAGENYKVQLCNQDGGIFDECTNGLVLYPQSGYGKYIALKSTPSSIGLTDLLNFKTLFDKFIASETFDISSEIFVESVADRNFSCWEIAGNSRNLQIGTYAVKNLIEGITAELSVSFLYPLALDEYAIVIDGVEIDRQSYGNTIRIATELLNAKETQIAFYENGVEKIRAKVEPTIPNCGVLYAIER